MQVKRNVSRYIDKLSDDDDIGDAFAYSMFRLSDRALQEILETIPDSERERLAACLSKATKAERTRTLYETACRKALDV